jgi:1-acyl-sn-glycerol-3-phosphate acyltransferase
MSRLKALTRALGFLALTLPLIPVQMLLLRFAPAAARALPHHYHRMLAWLFGIVITVQGAPPPAGPYLLAANHVSWLDIVILSAVAQVSFVAKKEVADWPLFGLLARLQRSVFIDRDRRHKTRHHADSIAARLAAEETIVLFPEGTSHDGASVLPFKSSFFAAATSPDIHIVPVTLAYAGLWGMPLTRRERPLFAWYGDMALVPHLWTFLGQGPLAVRVIFHAPLSVETGLNRKSAAETAAAAVRGGLVAALHGAGDLR